jgi:hypothetical protein
MPGWKALLLIACVGCSQNYSEKKVDEAFAEKGLTPVTGKTEKAPLPAGHPAVQAGPGRHSLGGISAVMPEGWRQVPPGSTMRVAEYALPGAKVGAGDATLAVFFFSGNQGGGLEANIERWYGQFSQPDGGSAKARGRRWEKTVNGMPVTLVDISGTYDGGMGPTQQPLTGYRMLGGIVQSPKGAFYFKLTGPEATVALWSTSFDRYLDSVQPE